MASWTLENLPEISLEEILRSLWEMINETKKKNYNNKFSKMVKFTTYREQCKSYLTSRDRWKRTISKWSRRKSWRERGRVSFTEVARSGCMISTELRPGPDWRIPPLYVAVPARTALLDHLLLVDHHHFHLLDLFIPDLHQFNSAVLITMTVPE